MGAWPGLSVPLRCDRFSSGSSFQQSGPVLNVPTSGFPRPCRQDGSESLQSLLWWLSIHLCSDSPQIAPCSRCLAAPCSGTGASDRAYRGLYELCILRSSAALWLFLTVCLPALLAHPGSASAAGARRGKWGSECTNRAGAQTMPDCCSSGVIASAVNPTLDSYSRCIQHISLGVNFWPCFASLVPSSWTWVRLLAQLTPLLLPEPHPAADPARLRPRGAGRSTGTSAEWHLLRWSLLLRDLPPI